jgi:hypothetical protein
MSINFFNSKTNIFALSKDVFAFDFMMALVVLYCTLDRLIRSKSNESMISSAFNPASQGSNSCRLIIFNENIL